MKIDDKLRIMYSHLNPGTLVVLPDEEYDELMLSCDMPGTRGTNSKTLDVNLNFLGLKIRSNYQVEFEEAVNKEVEKRLSSSVEHKSAPIKNRNITKGWVNVYPEGVTSRIHLSKFAADKGKIADRIACIHVEFKEGEGL